MPPDPTPLEEMETLFAASNNWAVSGGRSANGGAIVANDMHLRLGVPNTWYRAAWVFPDADEHQVKQVTGATLPGGPAMVIGSNGHIAWGLTNSGGNWSDLIEVDLDPGNADAYLTPQGKRTFEHHSEIIKIKGQADETAGRSHDDLGPRHRPRSQGPPSSLALGRPRSRRGEPEPHPAWPSCKPSTRPWRWHRPAACPM